MKIEKKPQFPTLESCRIKGMSALDFYDAKEANVDLLGFYDVYNQEGYKRIPDEVAMKCGGDYRLGTVLYVYERTAGGRIRFKTNSDCLAIKVKFPLLCPHPRMTPILNRGFDFYISRNGKKEVYGGLFNPPIDLIDGYEGLINLGDNEEKEITLHFPVYSEVSSLQIGIRRGASLQKHTPYKINKPVLFYGSSITQGQTASRPGLSYENIISRELDMNYINLGFASGCHGEDAIVNYMTTLDISAFVLDYDHNTPNSEELRATHFNVYEKMRKAKPDIPIIMATMPDFDFNNFDHACRRCVVMETYIKGIENGDKNLYFVDGAAFFTGLDRRDCTSDGIHPNDLGFHKMATAIGEAIKIGFKL